MLIKGTFWGVYVWPAIRMMEVMMHFLQSVDFGFARPQTFTSRIKVLENLNAFFGQHFGAGFLTGCHTVQRGGVCCQRKAQDSKTLPLKLDQAQVQLVFSPSEVYS